jgi:hypothetical protein
MAGRPGANDSCEKAFSENDLKPLLAPHHGVLTPHYLHDCHRLSAQLSGKPTHVVRAVLVAELQPHRVSFSRPGELPADPTGERGANRSRISLT